MKITDNKLVAEQGDPKVSFEQTPNVSGEFSEGLPDTIVIHYTAGASLGSSVSWLRNPAAEASAHVVVGKSGDIVQLAPFNIKAWHAGASSWRGRERMNNFSIGIELDNAGLLEQRVDGYYTNFGAKVKDDQIVLARHKHQNETLAWEAYTKEQLESLEVICLSLKENYPVVEIVGHDDVSPGRKVDPGPAFPMQQFRDKILVGRSDDAEVASLEENRLGLVTADFLNIRMRPAMEALKAASPLTKGTRVIVQETKGDWSRVKVDIEGWVSNKWLEIMKEE